VPKGYLSEIFVSFQGEGLYAGRRHLFVRLAGCNLRCLYCDTPDSLERGSGFRIFCAGEAQWVANPVWSSELLRLLRPLIDREGPLDGVAITGGEPLLQADFLSELLAEPDLPRPRLLETNGMLPEHLAGVLAGVDVVSMDIKIPSNTGEPDFWDEHARFLRRARGKSYVKVLVDDRTLPSDILRAVDLIADEAPETPLFLQPITDRQGRVTLEAVPLNVFYRIARQRLGDVRVLPQTHKMLRIP
jgi:7-carboxy-7-deazaguanine synthase